MVLQLLAGTEKTGQLEVRGEDEEHRGFLGVSDGRLVSAQYEDEDGYLALGAVFAIDRGDFEFLPQDRVEREDLSGDLEVLLARAAEERERVLAVREVIADDRVRFRLSERGTERGEITLAPAQWKALLLVDGRRDASAIAARLEMRRLSAQQLLADLVRAGLVDPTAAPEIAVTEEEAPRAYRRLPPMQPIPPTHAGEPVVIRGRIPDFPLETIVQLLAETKKTGRLEVRAGRDSSTLGMSDGRLVSATWGEEEGELALGASFTAQDGEFDFVPMADAPNANVSGALDPLLDCAAGIRDRIIAIRGLIPSDRARFTLSERATRNPEIVLTSDQWRVLLGVNGERDVIGIAEHLRMRRLPVMMVLADLVRGGYVDVIPATEQTWPYVERRKSALPTPVPIAPVVAEPAPIEGVALTPETVVEEPIVEEPIAAEEPIVEAAAPEEPVAEAPPEIAPEPAPAETLIAETPLDVGPTPDDRLAALSRLFGPAEPASPEAAAAAATAEAFASAPPPEPEAEPDLRLAAFGAPPAEPAWDTSSWEAPAPAEPEVTEVDPRLAAFGAPAAEPQAPAWDAAEAPPAEPAAAADEAATLAIGPLERMPVVEIAAPPAVAPAPAPEKKKGLFGRLFGGGAKHAPPSAAAAAVALAATRPGQLAQLANELVAAYNSGRYGKGRVEDRMLSLVMRADEQADPIDRPIPVSNDRLDVASIDREALSERQALPYLAVVVREIYDDAERALGKDKARRGFRDVRDRLFGKDLTLLHAPEVSGRLPKA